MLYPIIHFLIQPLFRLFYGFEVKGEENIPAQGGVVFCANHQSFLDPPVVAAAVRRRQIWFMARDTLFRNPLFAWLIRALHTFPVKRGAVDRSAVREFAALVSSGKGVLQRSGSN